jgi:RHS repeat-associated protein
LFVPLATFETDELFAGQRLDQSGLYYYGARYYDASIGRFISADTLVQSLLNPQCLNRYSYCINNPLKYIDPSGNAFAFAALIPFMAAAIATAAATVAAAVLIANINNNAGAVESLKAAGSAAVDFTKNSVTALVNAGTAAVNWLTSPGTGSAASCWNIAAEADTTTTPWAAKDKAKAPANKNSFRERLKRLTRGGEHVGEQAHHVIPKKFHGLIRMYTFGRINPNDPKYGSWWKTTDHLKNAWKYNKDWEKFLRVRRSSAEILGKAREMAEKYELEIHF